MVKHLAPKRSPVLWIVAACTVLAAATGLYVDRKSALELARPPEPIYTMPVLQEDDSPICAAASEGDVARLQELLQSGVAVDTPSSSGRTPLYLACAMKHFQAVALLLARGADPSARDSAGSTPLHAAVGYGSQEMKDGRSVRRADDSEKIVQALLERRAVLDVQDAAGDTPLVVAAREGLTGVVRQLLSTGAALHYRDESGRTALDYAEINHHDDIATLLRVQQQEPKPSPTI